MCILLVCIYQLGYGMLSFLYMELEIAFLDSGVDLCCNPFIYSCSVLLYFDLVYTASCASGVCQYRTLFPYYLENMALHAHFSLS